MTSESYKDDPARNKTVFIRKRLDGESGVVEAKYERKDESVGLEAYEAAIHEYYDHRTTKKI